MKKMNRAISTAVLVCFLFNTAISDLAFGQTLSPDSDKLAAALRTDTITGPQPYRMAKAEFALGNILEEIGGDSTSIDEQSLNRNIEREAGGAPLSKLGLHFFFSEMPPAVNGIKCVRCDVRDGDKPETFYVVFSLNKTDDGHFFVESYTKDQAENIYKDWTNLALTLPMRSVEIPQPKQIDPVSQKPAGRDYAAGSDVITLMGVMESPSPALINNEDINPTEVLLTGDYEAVRHSITPKNRDRFAIKFIREEGGAISNGDLEYAAKGFMNPAIGMRLKAVLDKLGIKNNLAGDLHNLSEEERAYLFLQARAANALRKSTVELSKDWFTAENVTAVLKKLPDEEDKEAASLEEILRDGIEEDIGKITKVPWFFRFRLFWVGADIGESHHFHFSKNKSVRKFGKNVYFMSFEKDKKYYHAIVYFESGQMKIRVVTNSEGLALYALMPFVKITGFERSSVKAAEVKQPGAQALNLRDNKQGADAKVPDWVKSAIKEVLPTYLLNLPLNFISNNEKRLVKVYTNEGSNGLAMEIATFSVNYTDPKDFGKGGSVEIELYSDGGILKNEEPLTTSNITADSVLKVICLYLEKNNRFTALDVLSEIKTHQKDLGFIDVPHDNGVTVLSIIDKALELLAGEELIAANDEKLPNGGKTFFLTEKGKKPKDSPSILEAAEENIKSAAQGMKLHPDLLEMILNPKRVTTVNFEVTLDNGKTSKLWGFRAMQNDARGPAKGGIRWLVSEGETLEDAKESLDEVRQTAVGLATLMTVKNAVIGIPYGGGKGDVFIPKGKYTDNDKARIIRGFSRELTKEKALGPFIDIPAPDKGTDARMMAWFMDEYLGTLAKSGWVVDKTIEKELLAINPPGNPAETPYLDKYIQLIAEDGDGILQGYELGMITGKPPLKGGSEGRAKATGFGGFLSLKAVLKHFSSVKDFSADTIGKSLNDNVRQVLRKDLSLMTAGIQGTGNVGEYHAWELQNAGVKILFLQDAIPEDGKIAQYTLYSPDGINIELLNRNLERLPDGRWAPLKTLPKEFLEKAGYQLTRNDDKPFWTVHTDIKVVAATENVIDANNAQDINCEIVLELANAPTTPVAYKTLLKRGILVIPDVLANAGGVTVSYYEWLQNIEGKSWTEAMVDKMLEERMNTEVRTVLAFAERYGIDLREAAYRLSIARTINAEIARNPDLAKKFTDIKPYEYYGELGLLPDTIEELNNIISEGGLSGLIKESEDAKLAQIREIADKAADKLSPTEIGFILITGPTTSGKLSFAINVMDRLKQIGRNAIALNFDELTAEDMKNLKYGEEIEVTDYIDGQQLKRKIKPEKGDIFVAQGNYTLSDEVLGVIPQRNRVGIFVNTAPSMKLSDNWPLTSLDLRLLRHILTMNHIEGTEAIEIIRRWPKEREEQIKYVYPAWVKADVTLNSYLPYELPIIKYHAEPLIDKAMEAAMRDKDESSIKIIERLQKTLKGVIAVRDTSAIPANSITQQYIGEKGFYEEFVSRVDSQQAIASSDATSQKTVFSELLAGWLDLGAFIQAVIETGVEQITTPPDDKTVLIFSEKATFGEYKNGDYEEGLGVILPSLIRSGIKVAVVATTDKQRALIDELNLELPSGNQKIIYADSVASVRSRTPAARYCYYKVASEPEADIKGVTSITIIVKKIIDAIGKVINITDSKVIEQMHEAARRFAIAA